MWPSGTTSESSLFTALSGLIYRTSAAKVNMKRTTLTDFVIEGGTVEEAFDDAGFVFSTYDC
jgi:hypothetical protein